jgi:hypothetical protein
MARAPLDDDAHRGARQRAPITLLSPASPDPEPQTRIVAFLGHFCFSVRPKVGCNLHDADTGQPANPANPD